MIAIRIVRRFKDPASMPRHVDRRHCQRDVSIPIYVADRGRAHALGERLPEDPFSRAQLRRPPRDIHKKFQAHSRWNSPPKDPGTIVAIKPHNTFRGNSRSERTADYCASAGPYN
jgi:hypothetical protein